MRYLPQSTQTKLVLKDHQLFKFRTAVTVVEKCREQIEEDYLLAETTKKGKTKPLAD